MVYSDAGCPPTKVRAQAAGRWAQTTVRSAPPDDAPALPADQRNTVNKLFKGRQSCRQVSQMKHITSQVECIQAQRSAFFGLGAVRAWLQLAPMSAPHRMQVRSEGVV